MPKIKNVVEVLNALRVKKIGKGDVIPGVRVAGTYSSNDIVDYSESKADRIIKNIRDEQGLSKLNVLTQDGVSLEVLPYAREVLVLTNLSEEKLREIQDRLNRVEYGIRFPIDKGDNL